MQIFSILSLFSLHKSISAYRDALGGELNNHLNIIEERLLNYVELKLLENIPSCYIPITDYQVLLKQPDSWWENLSCKGHINQWRFFYVGELLVSNACASISPEKQTYKVNYFRLTIRILSKSGVRRTVQTINAIVEYPFPGCVAEYFLEKTGRQARLTLEEN